MLFGAPGRADVFHLIYGLQHAMNGVTDCEVAGSLEGVDAGMEPTRAQRRAGAIRRWVWTCAITANIDGVMICYCRRAAVAFSPGAQVAVRRGRCRLLVAL